MEIQTNPELTLQTEKVKCLASHQKYLFVIAGHFNGDLCLYDPETLQLKKTNRITNSSIRTAVVLPTIDIILAGTDDGEIVVLDSASLEISRRIPAHADFIRKIVADESNCRFISTSDDNTVKLWEYKSEDFTILNIYKDSKHYVMDAAFDPSDPTLFYTASLDGKIRHYSIFNTKRISTCYNKSKINKKSVLIGINAIEFISTDLFATGNDDGIIDVFDKRRNVVINTFKAHLGQINSIRLINNKGYFITTSSDGSSKIIDENFKTVDVKYSNGKIWDACEKSGQIILGTDSEIITYKINQGSSKMILCSGKIFYSENGKLFMTKTGELNHRREIGEVNANKFVLSTNLKLISICDERKATIYSTLGMRNKLQIDSASDCFFIGNDSFYILKITGEVVLYENFEIINSFSVEGASSLLYGDSESFIVNSLEKKLCFYVKRDNILELPFAKSIAKVGNFFILIDDSSTSVCCGNGEISTTLPVIQSYAVIENVIFYSTHSRTFYGISSSNFHTFNINYIPNIIGVADGEIFYHENGKKAIQKTKIDKEFIDFQNRIFSDLQSKRISSADNNSTLSNDHFVTESIRSKAIAFYESLGMHSEALNICINDNQKFEILIKLNKLSEAFEIASSPAKFNKLGKAYLKVGMFEKAAKCFLKGNDIKSLFLADVFGKKEHLELVAEKSKEAGEMNLAFLALFKNNQFEECHELLKETIFNNLFQKKFILNKNE